jgi:hypothetical protein
MAKKKAAVRAKGAKKKKTKAKKAAFGAGCNQKSPKGYKKR